MQESLSAGSYPERDTPVLLIQGRHDTRTPARQAEAYIAKMQALSKPIEVYWFEKGHLAASVDRMIEEVERMLRFALRVCAGRRHGH